jgi:hypothetical protein
LWQQVQAFWVFSRSNFWDMTLKTNSEKHPLLFLVCGKDPENQTFTNLWAFMLSEWIWVFDWLYTRAIPHLLGKQILQWTNILLTNGDKNKYGPLQAQIQNGTLGMSQHTLCGFHLVDCLMVSNPFGKKPGSKEGKYFQSFKSQRLDC